jgi:sarcosine oxidase subunit alpha
MHPPTAHSPDSEINRVPAPATASETAAPGRLPTAGSAIDRSAVLRFTFDGREYTAHPGDTIASALAAAGIRRLSRSFKYHRPRGLLCCAGHCPNCLVQIGDEPNVRACRRPVEDGMAVRHQNAWPSLDYDLMSLTALGDRLLPVGFYYKAFIRPQALWPLYEEVLRRAAGLGSLPRAGRPSPEHPHPDDYSKQYLHADVLVVGGGPAGLAAARAAAGQGAAVLLIDENPSLGGHTRFRPGGPVDTSLPPNVTVLTDTTIMGWYLDHWLFAVRGHTLLKIRARAVVVAAGAYEAPLVFENNDLPGVMLGSAVQRLIHLYGVRPGRQAVVVAANDDGWQVAADLRDAGVRVAAIVDERDRSACASPHLEALSAHMPVFWRHTILGAQGSGAVNGARVARVSGDQAVDTATAQTLTCDLIAVSVGWTPAIELLHQAGGNTAYDEQRGEILPVQMPPGIYVAGRAAGTHTVANQLDEGRLTGRNAAAHAGFGAAPSASEAEALRLRRATEARRTSVRVSVPGRKKRFVCYCEDVTTKDIETSIDEGYNSLELLKRYSTVTMGPCQGKLCHNNAMHLCARANGWTVAQTGTTTYRQPQTPVELGALAGAHLEPVQVTPIHAWHLAHNAQQMVAGQWLRPLHYGDPAAEVRAVRERVGLIDVSTLGKLRLTGPGVPQLLDRLYVNQWRDLKVGRVRYGVMCNDEGVVLDDGVTARLGNAEWYTTTTTSGSTAIFEWIQWWLQSGWGDGVHVANVAEAYAAYNLAGPRSRDVLRSLTSADVSNAAFPYLHLRQMPVADVACRVMRIGFTGELSYEIHVPSGYALHVWEALMAAGTPHGIAPFGVEAQRVLRLEKGHLIVSQDTDAVTDPFAAGMAWAVKLDKPDFLGKRSLTRVAAEGSPQKLVGFKVVRPGLVPDEGLSIVRPRPENGRLDHIGYITSCKYSPTLGETIGLCWLPASLAQAGTAFTIRLENGALEEARVHHGAFYDPQGERLRS